MNHRTKQKDRAFAGIVLGLYLLFLCWLILFKLADSIDKIPHMRGINLIPFHYDQLAGSRFHLNEVFYNVLVFIPAGFYFCAFSGNKAIRGIAACALLSLAFEAAQWIFALGASDITDLITNTAGGAMGAIVYHIFRRVFKGKAITIASMIGAALEALCFGFLVVLFLANRTVRFS